ncbi:MAG: S1 RNA-binding domain-containing protein, partial [Clostridia bacterium]
AGISTGLITNPENEDDYVMLVDIQGIEDFLGDMDFKVAGTEKGITAIQMDIKIKGIDKKVLTKALAQAKVGRLEILGKMLAVIDKPRTHLNKYAPKIISFNIDPDKIRDVIGSGGKVINKIIEETGVKIDITDEGKVMIASTDEEKNEKAKAIIKDICFEAEVGQVFEGTVVRIMQFGAFVQLKAGLDGMVHISKLSKERVEKVEDVINIGDKVKVEVIKVDEKGRVDLKLIEKL